MKEFQSFLKTVAGNEGSRCHYPTRLDTYGCGCQHNCGYCYARSLLDFRKLWNPAYPSVANINRIRHAVRTRLRPGEIVRLGGMTDCFQPMERQNKVTYQTIQALNQMGVGYLIVTKSDLVATDEYMEILDRRLAHVQVSVTATGPAVSRKVEPGAPVPARRIAAVEKLQRGGVDACVRLSPFVPEFLDLDIVNAIQCDKCLVEFLRVNTWVRRWLTELDAGVDLSRYTLTNAGYAHLPLEEKKALLAGVTGFRELSVCEDVEAHWLYWRDHVNANPDDCCNLARSSDEGDR